MSLVTALTVGVVGKSSRSPLPEDGKNSQKFSGLSWLEGLTAQLLSQTRFVKAFLAERVLCREWSQEVVEQIVLLVKGM